jgi:glutathione S-transferase
MKEGAPMAIYRLYDFLPSGNGYKVRMLLCRLRIDYELVGLDILKGETRTPEFLAKNPNGRIPLLQLPDGACLPESGAILYYLAKGTSYFPDDKLEQAQVLQWMFFEQYSHEPAIAVARFIHEFEPPEGPRWAEVPRLQEKGYQALGVMETHLRDRAFFVAEACSIADIALYAYTHVAEEGGFDLEGYPAVRAWLDRVAAEPGHLPITAR